MARPSDQTGESVRIRFVDFPRCKFRPRWYQFIPSGHNSNARTLPNRDGFVTHGSAQPDPRRRHVSPLPKSYRPGSEILSLFTNKMRFWGLKQRDRGGCFIHLTPLDGKHGGGAGWHGRPRHDPNGLTGADHHVVADLGGCHRSCEAQGERVVRIRVVLTGKTVHG